MMANLNQQYNTQSRSVCEKVKIFSIQMLTYCEKKYKKLVKKDKVLQRWTENYLEELKTHPYLGEKLYVNFPGFRSIHFLGNKYRIIYKIIEETSQIKIFEIGHRKSSYSELAKAINQGK